jgi:hypothetical protein
LPWGRAVMASETIFLSARLPLRCVICENFLHHMGYICFVSGERTGNLGFDEC